MRWIIGLAALLATSAAFAGAPTEADWSAVTLASKRGQLIYAYDQAAWHGTDDLLAKLPSAMDIVGGWIVDGPVEAPTLIFFDQSGPNPRAVYVAEFDGTRLRASRVLGPTDDRTLSPARLALVTARRQALQAIAKSRLPRCSRQPPNSVVLPPDRPADPTLVYVLEPQPDGRTYPIGGNYRMEVTADGKVSTPHGFAKSCIAMSLPADQRPEMFFVTHLLDPVPTEIHVFASLASRLPIAVGTTNKLVWIVSAGEVRTQSAPKEP